MIAKTVRPVHFEDFSGADFERLVFAYHLRTGWRDLAWYGQTGSDLGRDIIGVQPSDEYAAQITVIQCVNRAHLTFDKASTDMSKAVAAPTGCPDAFKFVCRSAVSAGLRDKIAAEGRRLGIANVVIWSGQEFEEHLRFRAEFLLRRLVDGVTFPDAAEELRRFVDDFPELSDDDVLTHMAAVFDRAAFRTPFQEESYLPAFHQAIDDTIGALRTGVWRNRDGAEIRRIPCLDHLKDQTKSAVVRRVVQELDEVRRLFKRRLNDGSIRHCGCNAPNCPTFMLSRHAADELDAARGKALASFRSIWPDFEVGVR